MPSLVTSLVFAILVVVIPFSFVLKVLLQLPRPIAPSHRRWPLAMNFVLIAAVTIFVTFFIRNAYYSRPQGPLQVASEFLIAALGYGFGLVLLLRQFAGAYPEFIVTVGATGLDLRKTRYTNIQKVEKIAEARGETRFRIETSRAISLSFTLPTRYVVIFYDQMRKKVQQY